MYTVVFMAVLVVVFMVSGSLARGRGTGGFRTSFSPGAPGAYDRRQGRQRQSAAHAQHRRRTEPVRRAAARERPEGDRGVEDTREERRPGLTGPGCGRRQPVPSAVPGPVVTTLQEGLTQVAAGRAGMLLCRPTAAYHRREDVAFVPVEGVPESALGMV
ncbi:hypothetical protein GCM10023086_05850 [Streptomyces venetus]|uniref:Secreted protein n=1 Tax=Streptomyces venetus TaxID=1701086 RepID=A0ABP8F3F3_9ACTN